MSQDRHGQRPTKGQPGQYAADRVRSLMAGGFTGTVDDIAAGVFKARQTVGPILAAMHAAGELRIIAWRRQPKGEPVRVFGLADGKRDAPRPRRIGTAAACRKWRSSIRKRLGDEAGRAVLNAMDKRKALVVVSGRVIYRRGEGVLVAALEDAA